MTSIGMVFIAGWKKICGCFKCKNVGEREITAMTP
jgi:hypothetical protein